MNENNYIGALDAVFITVFSVVLGLYFGLVNDIKTIFGGDSILTKNSLIILFFVYIIILFTGYIFIINIRGIVIDRTDSNYKKAFLGLLLNGGAFVVLLIRERSDNVKFNFLIFYVILLLIWCLLSIIVLKLSNSD